MAIGIVTDNDFQIELERLQGKVVPSISPVQAEVVESPSKGRNEGDFNVPESLRKIIGEEAALNGRAAALRLAEGFGISASSVSAYAKGATSTKSYNEPSKELLQHINQSKFRAIKRASKTMNGALSAITQEKLDYADAKDLSTIAKDMSVVIKNLEPQSVPSSDSSSSAPQFIIYAPQFRREETFEVIQVNE